MTIPIELRQYNQWILWKLEDIGGKLVKKPISPHTGFVCDPTDKSSFTTYEHAVKMAPFASGIGFCLTNEDPFCFIDLDDTSDPDELELQKQIYRHIESYAERSQSKKGLHIFCKGKVPKGLKKRSIEIYSQDRYFAVTGDTFRANAILDYSSEIMSLWEYLGGNKDTPILTKDGVQTASDDQVISWALAAQNGEKFSNLFQGKWEQYYKSQSEADYALIDIIAYYTENKEQVRRIFLSSSLGQREKARRHPSYVVNMVNKSFDRKINIPNAVLETIANIENTGIENFQELKEKAKPQKITFPRGLLGEIAEYVYSISKRPLFEVSFVSAVGLMAGFTGRAYNVSESGLNMYVLLVGSTGIGKSAIKHARDRIFKSLHPTLPSMDTYRGPDEIASPEALLKRLREHPCFLSYSGEIGDLLSSMCHANPGTIGARMKRTLLNLYQLSGKHDLMGEMIYSDKQNNQKAIMSPSLTLIGETTPSLFANSIDESMVSNGFIPRFLIVECPQYVPPLQLRATEEPPAKLLSKIGSLVSNCLALDMQDQHIDVEFSESARRIFENFQQFCDAKINEKFDDSSQQIWNRANLKAMKLAALEAVGINHLSPVIDETGALWAIDIVQRDSEAMEQRVRTGEIASEANERSQIEVLGIAIARWFSPLGDSKKSTDHVKMRLAGCIPYSAIQKSVIGQKTFTRDRAGPTNAIQRCLRVMQDSGQLIEISRSESAGQFRTTGRVFRVLSPKLRGEV